MKKLHSKLLLQIAIILLLSACSNLEPPIEHQSDVMPQNEPLTNSAEELIDLTEEAEYELYTTKVAGVTFSNEDGSLRQEILEEIASHTEFDGDVSFQPYIYEGEPAIYVLYDDMCIGNIPADNVAEVMSIIEHPHYARLFTDSFTPQGEDRLIYYARVTIRYEE